MQQDRVREIPDEILQRCVLIWRQYIRIYSRNQTEMHGILQLREDPEDISHEQRIARCDAFAKSLLSMLTKQRDNHGKFIRRGKTQRYNCPTILSTGTHPTGLLEAAAKKAKVPGTWFPTHTYTALDSNCIETQTYQSVVKYHHRTKSGWLICALNGADMPQIINAAEAGLLPDFKIKKGL